jgi:hypothetical protein
VEERQQAQDRLARLLDGVQHGLGLLGVVAEVGVGQHDSLGHARGAAGVLQGGKVLHGVHGVRVLDGRALQEALPGQDRLAVVGDRFELVLAPGFQRVEEIQGEAQAVGDGGDEDAPEVQLVAQAADALPEQVQGDEGPGFGVVEVVDQFLLHVQGVGHDDHCPELEAGPVGNDRLGAVGQHDGHPLAGLDARLLQVGAAQVHQALELLEAHGPVVEDDGRPVWVVGGGAFQDFIEGDDFVVQVRTDFLIVMLEPDSVDALCDHGPSMVCDVSKISYRSAPFGASPRGGSGFRGGPGP